MYGCESWAIKKLSTAELMLLNCGVGEDSWKSLGLPRDQTCQSYRKSVLNIHWKDWCCSWSSNTLTTWWEELAHWKRGTTEGEMVRWHHWPNGHGFEQALGVSDGQRNLACCSRWVHKKLDTTEWLKWNWVKMSHVLLFVDNALAFSTWKLYLNFDKTKI